MNTLHYAIERNSIALNMIFGMMAFVQIQVTIAIVLEEAMTFFATSAGHAYQKQA